MLVAHSSLSEDAIRVAGRQIGSLPDSQRKSRIRRKSIELQTALNFPAWKPSRISLRYGDLAFTSAHEKPRPLSSDWSKSEIFTKGVKITVFLWQHLAAISRAIAPRQGSSAAAAPSGT